MPSWVSILDRVIQCVSVPAQTLWIIQVWYNRIGLDEPVKIRGIRASLVIEQLNVSVSPLIGEAVIAVGQAVAGQHAAIRFVGLGQGGAGARPPGPRLWWLRARRKKSSSFSTPMRCPLRRR